MILTFSDNPLDKLSCWFENEILTPISRFYYTHKKKHYQCCVCGHMVSPYFDDSYKCSPIYDAGWHKFGGTWPRYICHHCADHGYSETSWDEWQEHVQEWNNKLKKTIKEKDREYYNYWFNGGYESELFAYFEEDDDDE